MVEEYVEKMIDMKIIEPVSSNWASPIVLVKKPDGSERFFVDYWKVYEVTIKDSFPMPSVESKMNKLYGCKLFSSVDCTSVYWQIKLSEKGKQITAFVCHKGSFAFNVMPFGLCNAGQRSSAGTKKNSWATIYAVEKFRYYLYGKEFVIITDNNPLTYLENLTLKKNLRCRHLG